MTPELKTDLHELMSIIDRIPPIVAHQKDHDTGANVGEPVRTFLVQVPEILVRRIQAHMALQGDAT